MLTSGIGVSNATTMTRTDSSAGYDSNIVPSYSRKERYRTSLHCLVLLRPPYKTNLNYADMAVHVGTEHRLFSQDLYLQDFSLGKVKLWCRIVETVKFLYWYASTPIV